jgi:integrase
VQKFKSTGDGIHTWSEDEVARFIERHPVGTKAHLALMLMLYTGQRGRSDAARMGWQHVRGGKIAVRQEKTNTPLMIPIAPALMQALEVLPRRT